MLKPSSLLLYLLAIIASFFVGLSIAGLIEAGKHQALAGGAIVLGYGVMGAVIGLLIALFIAWKSSYTIRFRLNIFLALGILAFFVYFHFKFRTRFLLFDG